MRRRARNCPILLTGSIFHSWLYHLAQLFSEFTDLLRITRLSTDEKDLEILTLRR